MSKYPDAIEELIIFLKKLPGVGRRGAERMALSMLEWDADKLALFGQIIGQLPQKIGRCPECGALAAAGELCLICRQANRDRAQICVVEDPSQIFAIEASNVFKGVYHCLGGKLSPLNGIDQSKLEIGTLLNKARSGAVKEIILALSSDVEGRATAVYLADLLKDCGVSTSQLAQGIPAGANLSYADGVTIAAALNGRIKL